MKVGDCISVEWVDRFGCAHSGDTAIVVSLEPARMADEFSARVVRSGTIISAWPHGSEPDYFKGVAWDGSNTL